MVCRTMIGLLGGEAVGTDLAHVASAGNSALISAGKLCLIWILSQSKWSPMNPAKCFLWLVLQKLSVYSAAPLGTPWSLLSAKKMKNWISQAQTFVAFFSKWACDFSSWQVYRQSIIYGQVFANGLSRSFWRVWSWLLLKKGCQSR